MVADLLVEEGVPSCRIGIAESTRESFTVNETSTGKQYRFVLPGPQLSGAEQAQCLDELRRMASCAEFVVASGSLPPGVPADWYQRVADVCREVGALLILDSSGSGLNHVKAGVFLLKPSVRELRECVGRELATEAEQVAAAHELIDRGIAQAVVVSLGAGGAVLATRGCSQRFTAVPVHERSGVGAGDAMVAAITVGLSRAWPLSEAVRYGIAAGAAKLRTPGTATFARAEVERILPLVAAPMDIDRPTTEAMECDRALRPQ
jgi:6-phosphofructokinase 2